MEAINDPTKLLNLNRIVEFYRYFLSLPEEHQDDIVENFVYCCLLNEIENIRENMTDDEVSVWIQQLMDFIKS
jgi:hypothetical protein